MYGKKITTIVLLSAAVLSTACQKNISSNSYSANNVGAAAFTYQGVIIDVQQVNVTEKERLGDNMLGAGLGAVAGGVAGSAVGKGYGQLAAIGAGALLGGVGGAFAEQALGQQQGMKYTVKLANGQIMNIVQGVDNPMRVGQRVFVEMGSGRDARSRVFPDNTNMPMESQPLQPQPTAPAVVIYR